MSGLKLACVDGAGGILGMLNLMLNPMLNLTLMMMMVIGGDGDDSPVIEMHWPYWLDL